MAGFRGVWHSQRDFRDRSLHEYDTGDAAAARRMMGISNSSVIVPSDGEALVYFHIADNMGHPLAREYLRSLDQPFARRAGSAPASRRKRRRRRNTGSRPTNSIPMGDTASGVPHTDECTTSFERERALALVEVGVPFRAVQQALWFLGLSRRRPCAGASAAGPVGIQGDRALPGDAAASRRAAISSRCRWCG